MTVRGSLPPAAREQWNDAGARAGAGEPPRRPTTGKAALELKDKEWPQEATAGSHRAEDRNLSERQRDFVSLRNHALGTALACIVFGVAWVAFSDLLLRSLVDDQTLLRELQEYAGSVYVLVTVCLIYYLVRSHVRRIPAALGGEEDEADPGRERSSSAGQLKRHALRFAAAYALIGLVWIMLCDTVRTAFATPMVPGGFPAFENALFALLTAGVIYAGLKTYLSRIDAAERAVRRNSIGIREVIDLVPHMIFAKDESGRVLLCNRALAEAYGTTVENILQWQGDAALATHRMPHQPLTADENRLIESRNGSLTIEEAFVDAYGERRVLQTTKVPFAHVGEDASAILGVSLDITRHKQIEQALIEEKERAEITLHSISDAVITTDRGGELRYLNPSAERLTGWTLAEAGGKRLDDVFKLIDEQTRQPIPVAAIDTTTKNALVTPPDRHVLIGRHGNEYAIEDSIAPIRLPGGDTLGIVIVFRDVTDSRRMARRMIHLATHDPLTGLVNRREFERRLKRVVIDAKTKQSEHVLCYLDLDQFKIVNDAAGHGAGDALLTELATRLRGNLRSRDTFARLGGDEFSVLLENCALHTAITIANALVGAVRDFPFTWQGRSFEITVSIGLVPITRDVEDMDQVLSQGDIACYTAKDLGRNRIHVYQPDDGEFNRRQSEILRVADLSDALSQKRFCLYAQPIFAMDADPIRPRFLEVLVRLVDEHGNLVLPAAFIPAAERLGLMTAIDRWIVRTAIRHFFRYNAEFGEVGISINLSGSSLNDDRLLQLIREELSELEVAANRICFEITETAAVSNLERAAEFIRELKAIGCEFALDDFGSGLSSFNYLKNLHVDYLKIDGSFVHNMASDSIDHAMVAAINQVGHVMGIQTVAECADSHTVVEQLQSLGVDMAQGAYLGAVQPLEEIASSLKSRTPGFPFMGREIEARES